MHFFGSERGLLATPTQCGTYPVTSTFTPWDSSLAARRPRPSSSPSTPGPTAHRARAPTRPFNPGFEAASLEPQRRRPRALLARSHPLGRRPEPRRAHGDHAAGLLGDAGRGALLLRRGPGPRPHPAYSGIAELQSPSCPAGGQIGTAVAGAGAGTHPVYLPGKVYLAGPYKGAPPQSRGDHPGRLGPLRPRQRRRPRGAARRPDRRPDHRRLGPAAADRRKASRCDCAAIRVGLDRPDFTLNPTNCEPFSVGATLSGDQGAVASLSRHFQVANCGTLSFGPKLALRFSGPTTRAKSPALHATLTRPSG